MGEQTLPRKAWHAPNLFTHFSREKKCVSAIPPVAACVFCWLLRALSKASWADSESSWRYPGLAWAILVPIWQSWGHIGGHPGRLGGFFLLFAERPEC
eukprot:8270007-Pyramimonas_sp.AAC.1